VYINPSSLTSIWTVFDGRLFGQKREADCAQQAYHMEESNK
jgi:hypothetical protein